MVSAAARVGATLAAPACLACLLTATPSHADNGALLGPEQSRIDARIEYRVPPSCPSDATFAAQLTARAPRLRRVYGGPSRSFVVEVKAHEGAYRGQLLALEAGGGEAAREMVGDSCDEVVGALGLVLALAIDPMASLASPVSTGQPMANPAAARAVRAFPIADPLVAPAAPEIGAHAGRTALASPAGVDQTSLSSSAAPARIQFAAGGGVASTLGVAPSPMAGFALFVEAAPALASSWLPLLRLGVQQAWSGAVDVTGAGSARFSSTVGTLDACPLRWGTDRLALMPCVRLDGGVLGGRGSNIAHPSSSERLWFDAGAVARLRWAFAWRLFADLEAGALVPITRPRFHFDAPDLSAPQPGLVGAVTAFHLGSRFW